MVTCPSCGNDASMLIMMGQVGSIQEYCEECDPFNRYPIRPNFICPHNDIYCMFEWREGKRSGCSCWGCDLNEWSGPTAFCRPNKTLLHSLKNSSNQKDQNRLIGILSSEKIMRKLFHFPERVPYQIKIIDKDNSVNPSNHA